MFLVRQPDRRTLDEILARAHDVPLSYVPIGLAETAAPAAFRVAEARAVIGRGADVFRTAARALTTWRPFELGWVNIYPRAAPVTSGTDVLVIARHLGFWSVNACRVVYVLGDDVSGVGGRTAGSEVGVGGRTTGSEVGVGGRESGADADDIAGFAYGTLAEHAEIGEEIFEVRFDSASQEVTYRIRAVSRERALLARIGFPLARAFQRRFRRDSIAAMHRHIAETAR